MESNLNKVPMKPSKPYIIRAVYEWIIDSHLNPHMVIDVKNHDLRLPSYLMSDSYLVVDVSPGSVRDLAFTKRNIRFITKFSGSVEKINVPTESIRALYSAENHAGVVFFE